MIDRVWIVQENCWVFHAYLIAATSRTSRRDKWSRARSRAISDLNAKNPRRKLARRDHRVGRRMVISTLRARYFRNTHRNPIRESRLSERLAHRISNDRGRLWTWKKKRIDKYYPRYGWMRKIIRKDWNSFPESDKQITTSRATCVNSTRFAFYILQRRKVTLLRDQSAKEHGRLRNIHFLN